MSYRGDTLPEYRCQDCCLCYWKKSYHQIQKVLLEYNVIVHYLDCRNPSGFNLRSFPVWKGDVVRCESFAKSGEGAVAKRLMGL